MSRPRIPPQTTTNPSTSTYSPPTSRPSSPRPISPFTTAAPLNHSIASEWQRFRSMSPPSHPYNRSQFHFAPRSTSRPHSPPSLSPSPAPSLGSYHTDHREDCIEIEELDNSSDEEDSAIELLVGEYEEAPEDYGRQRMITCEDGEENGEEEEGENHILYGLERLSANRSPSPIIRAMVAQQFRESRDRSHLNPHSYPHYHQQQQHWRKSKRSYAESANDSESEEYESPSENGRNIRRRVVSGGGGGKQRHMTPETLSSSSLGCSRASSVEVDMEL